MIIAILCSAAIVVVVAMVATLVSIGWSWKTRKTTSGVERAVESEEEARIDSNAW